MFRKSFALICLFISSLATSKAEVVHDDLIIDTTSHLRVSLVTCGVGEELYASFGHTAIRIVDSVKGLDIAYNYGTFSFGEDFYPKFIRGKLMYYLSRETYSGFIGTYIEEKRSVEEQLLILPAEKKLEMYEFLEQNALPSNREYKYDFLFDNCATRVRDVFPGVLGRTFAFGRVLPHNSRTTYRNIIDYYLRNKHWERFGIDLSLGSPVDSIMTNEDVMFLPDYLRDAIADATYDRDAVGSGYSHNKLAAPTVVIMEGSEENEGTLNQPLVLTSIIAILTILGLTVPKLKSLGRAMTSILLFITGLLGCYFLFMWLGTDHQSCQDNYNVLWALPTNLFLAFIKKRKAGRYALVAIFLLIVSLFFHLLKVQDLPLLELGPILLSLVFVYGMIYKGSRAQSNRG